MNNEQLQFLEYLKKALHPNLEINCDYSKDIKTIFQIAESQKVFPVIYAEIARLPEYRKNDGVLLARRKAADSVVRQAGKTEAFLNLYKKFSEKGLFPTVLKGIICRKCYGNLEHLRESCDEDILVRGEEFRAVCEVLYDEGYLGENTIEITDKLLLEMQEMTFYNPRTLLSVEVHTNPIGKENKIRRQINDFFCNIADRIDVPFRLSNGGTVLIRTYCDTDHFLFLIFHAFKHFTFYGFGIRQCIDILVFQENKADTIDWKKVKQVLQRFGVLTFLADMQQIGKEYLGFDFQLIANERHSKDLVEDLLLNGVYGNSTQAQRTAEGLTSAVLDANLYKNKKFKTWLYTVFPKRERLIQLHPELVNKPWLLPVCWIKRIWRLLKHAKDYKGDLYKESIEISNRRVALMKKYKIF